MSNNIVQSNEEIIKGRITNWFETASRSYLMNWQCPLNLN